MWVMPRKLSRDLLVGTTAVYFGATNWIKVPAYIALGQFTAANMLITATLIPVAILSTFAGVALVRRVSPDKFNRIIYVLRSEEHTSELQSLMRISYAVFC